MKSIKIFMLAIAIISGSVLKANTVDPTKPVGKTTSKEAKASMNKQLIHLLTDATFKVNEETVIQISFTVNKDNEIVVLDVSSEDSVIRTAIQNRLNYNKLTAEVIKGQTYFLPLRLVVNN
ncbi:hypothetical protein [Leeuwenhoekiella sp. MAR_2009_132]|uniref:hypothetical protein n=1 Tax=Leeuwenhoekiella sp. MAR_2009_132 TaxID=1392489 RepID=UPI00056B73D2|nr:hypothetical protein [Leeuwenhoekiella sp. MAR_2009_132]